jgi:hypothetical protein
MEDTGNMGEENYTTDFPHRADITAFYEGNRPGIDGNLTYMADAVADTALPFPDKSEALYHERRRAEEPPGPLNFPHFFPIEFRNFYGAADLPGYLSRLFKLSFQILSFSGSWR